MSNATYFSLSLDRGEIDRFARVSFHKCNEGRKRLLLNRGFVVAGRTFEFLAYTKNQAFASTAWFVSGKDIICRARKKI